MPAELPSYLSDSVVEVKEKPDLPASSFPCQKHNPTPHLDAHFRTPAVKAHLLALSAALADLANGDKCTDCAIEIMTTEVTSYVREMKAAKKSGQASNEEKKALKGELKGLGKQMKREVKGMWKGRGKSGE